MSKRINKITILKGFDAHFHARSGKMMQDVFPYTAQQFAGGVAMGNLPGDEVIDTLEKHAKYFQQISTIAPDFNVVVPLMITRNMIEAGDSIALSAKYRNIPVFKFIPGGGITTNGAEGLTLYDLYTPIFQSFLRSLVQADRIFSCHFEVGTERIQNDALVNAIEQEKKAIRFLKYLLEVFPGLRIIVEHPSTEEMIDFIWNLPKKYKVGATPTIHHAMKHIGHTNTLLNCKPCIKTVRDNKAVKLAMCSGNPRFFAGTDSAPHLLEAKLRTENPATGNFSAPIAMQGYANIFDSLDRLTYLENFTSVFGRQFYGIPQSKETITLHRTTHFIPETLHGIPILDGGGTIPWSIAE